MTTNILDDEDSNKSTHIELLEPISDMRDKNDRQFITALARGLELLRCFTPQRPYLGNQDLSQLTGLPKGTITRLTYTLVKLGYLKQSTNSSKYQLSAGVLGFGYTMMANISINNLVTPYMEELADYANSAVAMATRDRLRMVYLNVVQGSGTTTMRRNVGSYLPIHLSSMGRACLASMPAAEQEFILDAIRSKYKDDWLKIRRGLDKAFRDYDDYGYCFSISEWQKDVNAVATAIMHPTEGLLTFNCGAPSFVLSRTKLEEDIAPRLLHMKNNIESNIYIS
ncbi:MULTISPECIES: IclR family transcriptional regulator [Psychrobacter]|jgi:DNA-binding IclR family transcriptional regulator|uniref:Transcriptional regulator n=1 Tax=Psychrobacter glaciei TaxID=619771 RepID=A0ABQ3GRP6_9GAMM|nr:MULTISPECIES: IclR family transcriptional regulator [Psychrobacter]MBF4489485.1 IclR family transcriptional regulator [Psychrobacter sp. N25K4-3-2]MBP3945907.1 IclR family transcriptional regulator [Psychrobacter sp. K31L]MCH1782454.1 IclR family transcriptional regulator [Psychrobacter glaciei]GHD33374.1 transcriptional regulator [Psychrobacter glaciei]